MTDRDSEPSPSESEKALRGWGLLILEPVYEAPFKGFERRQQMHPSDPAFTVLDELEDELPSASATTDASEEADLVEEWHGSDESFTLVDDPSTRT